VTKDILNALGACVGAANVLSGHTDRSAYDLDAMGKYPGHSLAVVRPADTGEVSGVLKIASAHNLAVVPQGGNTGLTGASVPDASASQIVLSLARMNKIRDIDAKTRVARVEAGVVLQSLHEAAQMQDLIFPLFFGARGSAMIGGVLSTNAGGSNVLRYGNARALVLGIEVVLADGRIMNLMSELYKDNSGYDLRDLFIGAEGTLGVITGAVLKLYPRPRAYATALMSLNTLPDALDLLTELQDLTGNAVEAFEFMPANYFDDYARRFADRKMPLSAPGPVNILVEIGATSAALARTDKSGRAVVHTLLEEALSARLEAGRISDATIAQNESQRAALWHCRECAFELATMHGAMVDHDISVPPAAVETFLAKMPARLQPLAPDARVSVIAHLGDGNLHYSVQPKGCARGVPDALADKITEAVEDLVQSLAGSFSAEHGIGRSKRATMARRKDKTALEVMRTLKTALDPQCILNPGKLLP